MDRGAILIVAEQTRTREALRELLCQVTPWPVYTANGSEAALAFFSEPLGAPRPGAVILGDGGQEEFLRLLFDHPDRETRLTAVFEPELSLAGKEPAMGLAQVARLIGAVKQALL